jgi:hypothetical protein
VDQPKREARQDDDAGALKGAVRRARVEQAERSHVVAELRGAEIARLEMLFDAFKPILAQAPAEMELFDAGITQGERPRLFIDMIAFVEMAHDRRNYRFIQETRHGRVLLAEGEATGHCHSVSELDAELFAERDGVLYLNPGSAGPRRFTLPIAIGLLEINGSQIHAELKILEV